MQLLELVPRATKIAASAFTFCYLNPNIRAVCTYEKTVMAKCDDDGDDDDTNAGHR